MSVAHARWGDPSTSHAAAAAATPTLLEKQQRVADYARRCGPGGFVDLQMSEFLGDTGSTMRTRRAELSARNIILDTGLRRTWGDSARKRIVWVHRDWVPRAPAVVDPTAPGRDALAVRALQAAAELAEMQLVLMSDDDRALLRRIDAILREVAR